MPTKPARKNPTLTIQREGKNGKQIRVTVDGLLSDQLSKLAVFYNCSQQRVIEAAVRSMYEAEYASLLKVAMSAVKLDEDGSIADQANTEAALTETLGLNEWQSKMIAAHAARKLRFQLVREN